MKTFPFLLVLQLLALSGPVNAAQVTLSASTLTATIAEHVELRLIVRSLEDVDDIMVTVPTGDFEILRRKRQPLIKTAEWRTFEQVLTIVFFKPGEFIVGPMKIELLTAGTVVEKEQSGTVTVKIRSLLGENDKDIRPMKKLLPIRGDPLHLIKYFAGAGLLLVVLLLIFKLKKGKKDPDPAVPLPDPEIELEIHVRELWQKKLPQKGENKLFFILLGKLIKRFLTRSYQFNADDLTSTEIIDRLQINEKDHEIIHWLQAVFQQADLVKFARQTPAAEAINVLADTMAALIGKFKKRRSLEIEADHVQTGH